LVPILLKLSEVNNLIHGSKVSLQLKRFYIVPTIVTIVQFEMNTFIQTSSLFGVAQDMGKIKHAARMGRLNIRPNAPFL
jgi:hypothetical protein